MPVFIKTEQIKKEFLIQKDIRNKIIKEHINWIKQLNKKGIDIKSGFLVDEFKKPGAGGLLILKMENYKDALAIVHNDPMIKNDLVDWQLLEWINVS